MRLRELLVVSVMIMGVKAGLYAASPSVTYLAPRFDGNGHLLAMEEAQCTEFTLLDVPAYSGVVQLNTGWYVVSNGLGNVVFLDGLTVNGDVHLIVCNGQTLESKQSGTTLSGIEVQAKGSLTIYAQSPYTNDMGRITVFGGTSRAGIEGGLDSSITINGGWIEAAGGSGAAGIGGAQYQSGENITVNGGYIVAQGGRLGAGIGGGENGDGKNITINGGTIKAANNLAGEPIGGGSGGASSSIVFTGGCIVNDASPAPVNAEGQRVYEVTFPFAGASGQVYDVFSGACTITFKNGVTYYAHDLYPIDDAGNLLLYLADGDYEVSTADESQCVKRYHIVVTGGKSKFERIYDYVTFENAGGFSLATANSKKNWDAELFWSNDLSTWSEWTGEGINAVLEGGTVRYRIYLRGTANTYLSRGEGERWVLSPAQSGDKIACLGNLETLRGGGEDDPAPATMARRCFNYLFSGCTDLSSTPTLPATNLAVACYAYMFQNCTSLVEPVTLPAKLLPPGCYEGMFKGCSGILINPYRKGKVWQIPSDAIGAEGWNTDMFADTGYFFMTDPGIGKMYFISLLTLVNPADPPRYDNLTDATNGVATSFVIWPNQEVRAAQPSASAYNGYFWVTNEIDEATQEHVLDVRMTASTSNIVMTALQACLPELVEHITNEVPYTVLHTIPGIYYGIAGTTNLLDFVNDPQALSNVWTVGQHSTTGTMIRGHHPAWPSDKAFYRPMATIVP